MIAHALGRTRARAAAVLLLAVFGSGGCSVPNHMHVTQGIAPANVDTNVRFRTTYYLRVFDYCWAKADEARKRNLAGAPGMPDFDYDRIIPESDVLYRYRMTGKASALGNKIRFEAGTLSAAQIDPFGASIKREESTGKLVLETAGGTGSSISGSDTGSGAVLGAANPCPSGQLPRQGFMIMGPEGMVPYDQNSRLVLAMHSSADPLIATLQEYSGRLIAAKVNPSEQLLPLVQENMRSLQAQRALDQLAAAPPGAAPLTIDQIADSAIAAFGAQGAAK